MSVGPYQQRRTGNILATVALLLVHAGLAAYLLFLNLGIAMSTDPCAYVECGDEQWIWVAMFLATWVNGAVLFIDIAVSIVFLTKRRIAAVVPVIGCIGHLALIGAAIAVASMAGPVSGSQPGTPITVAVGELRGASPNPDGGGRRG